MIKRFFHAQIAAAERKLGVSLDYMHHVVDHAPGAAWRFARFSRLAGFSSELPAEVIAVALVASSQVDDCGSCVQIGVNLARQQGVDPALLRAVLEHQPERLPPELADVYEFSKTVTAGRDVAEPLRARLRQRYGERGLIELSMAIALHRAYPTFKRALGHAQSCSRVTIGM